MEIVPSSAILVASSIDGGIPQLLADGRPFSDRAGHAGVCLCHNLVSALFWDVRGAICGLLHSTGLKLGVVSLALQKLKQLCFYHLDSGQPSSFTLIFSWNKLRVSILSNFWAWGHNLVLFRCSVSTFKIRGETDHICT